MSTPAFHQSASDGYRTADVGVSVIFDSSERGRSSRQIRRLRARHVRLHLPDKIPSSPVSQSLSFDRDQSSRAPLRPVHHRVLRAQAVTQMLRLLALDLSTATSAEMDGLRPRFVCEPCDAEIQRWTDCASPLTDKDFMTWRTCITHALQQHGKPKAPRLALRSLTDEERVYCEMRKQGPHWGCARCTYHVSKSGSAGSWLYRDEIVQHVQSAHGIQEHVNGRDLFYDYGVRYPSCACSRRRRPRLNLRSRDSCERQVHGISPPPPIHITAVAIVPSLVHLSSRMRTGPLSDDAELMIHSLVRCTPFYCRSFIISEQ